VLKASVRFANSLKWVCCCFRLLHMKLYNRQGHVNSYEAVNMLLPSIASYAAVDSVLVYPHIS
jgi:hypothetical protein